MEHVHVSVVEARHDKCVAEVFHGGVGAAQAIGKRLGGPNPHNAVAVQRYRAGARGVLGACKDGTARQD